MRITSLIAHKRKKSYLLLGSPDYTGSTLTSSTFALTANGSATTTLEATIDRNGVVVDGEEVTFAVSRTFVSASLSSADGTAAISDNGTDIATCTLTVLDTDGNPLPGIPAASCVMAVSGTGNTLTQPSGVTDANGQISGSFVSTNSEAKTVTWTVAGLAVTDTQTVSVTGTETYGLRAPAVDDFYLDPAAGVDGTGTEASPWNVFTNAKLSTLTAGKILWIKNGTFNWASLTTLASGTSGNRIKIAAYPGHTPVATLSTSTVGFDSCYGFGKAGGCSYWDIVGITFNLAGRAGIMFGATQWSNPALAATYIRIIDCIGNTTLAASDNGGILFFDSGSDNVQVIRGTYTATGATGGTGTNRALIWADYQRYIKVIGVDLNAAGTSLPFYYKHTNLQTAGEVDRVFKNNIVRGGSRGTLFCGKFWAVTNNVFDGALVDFGDQGGGDAGRGENTIVHNTFRNATLGLTINGTGGENYDNVVRDNVFTGTGELWDNPYAATDFRTVSSYNCYDSGAAEIRRNSTTYSLAGYQAAFPTREVSSVSGTITFNGSVPTSTPSDWRLTAASQGKADASDGTDCGVDINNLLTVGSVAPDFEEDWTGVTNQATATATPTWFNTDYTYWGASDGLSVNVTDGDPASGSGVCIQSNIPAGAQGFTSGGGFGFTFATGVAPAEEAWIEIWAKAAVGFDPAGSGGGSADYKAMFNAGGDSYSGGTGVLVATGRSTIGKWGNMGILDRMYSYPNTSYDTRYVSLTDDIGNLGWVRYRIHDRMGTGANGIFNVEVYVPGGTRIVETLSGFTPSARYMGYVTLGNNLNQFITNPTTVRWGRVRVWLAGNDPGWGF